MVELNFQPGDYVRLRLAKREIEGIVLESQESGIYLLKLKTGYNIGISKEHVLAGRALKKFKDEKKTFALSNKKGLPNVGLIVTGGTIASKADPKTGAVTPMADAGEYAQFYPELFDKVNVKKLEMPFLIASESMSSEHWIKIAEEAEKMVNDKDIEGVIITHGTDTLHYTAAALSFFFKKLNKPIVLTYSQRSIDRGSSDANLNLQCAAEMALSDCAEVVLVGHASSNDDFCYALRGSKVKKMHTTRRDAFKSINARPLAKVFTDRVDYLDSYNSRNKEKAELDTSFTDRVALVKYFPGQDPAILDFLALKYKGVVFEGTGLGHLPTDEASQSWIPALKKHIRNGFVACVASQCQYGRVDPYVYANGRKLKEAGVIFLEDMLPETAFVKLSWILGHHGWKGKAGEKMLENVSGELNDQLAYAGY